jgi:hypothetical protein
VPASRLSPEDVQILAAAGQKAAQAMKAFTDAMAATVRRFHADIELWRILANTPEAVAGLEGRYQVRAGLDHAYADPAHLDAMIYAVLDGTADGTILLTPTSRATVAAAALRGWALHYGGQLPPEGLTWGRVLGDTHVLVTREAAA